MCTRIGGYLQLKAGVIQVVYEMLWKKQKEIIEMLGKPMKL
jgi:hypothetical protein